MPEVAQQGWFPEGYGWDLLQILLSLVAICLLAWIVLKWGAKHGMGNLRWLHAKGHTSSTMKVLEKLPLDAKHSIWRIQVDNEELLVGTGASGPPTLLRSESTPNGPESSADPSPTD